MLEEFIKLQFTEEIKKPLQSAGAQDYVLRPVSLPNVSVLLTEIQVHAAFTILWAERKFANLPDLALLSLKSLFPGLIELVTPYLDSRKKVIPYSVELIYPSWIHKLPEGETERESTLFYINYTYEQADDDSLANVQARMLYTLLVTWLIVVKDCAPKNFIPTIERRWQAYCADFMPCEQYKDELAFDPFPEDFSLVSFSLRKAFIPFFMSVTKLYLDDPNFTGLSCSRRLLSHMMLLASGSRMTMITSIDGLITEHFQKIVEKYDKKLASEAIIFRAAVSEEKERLGVWYNYSRAFLSSLSEKLNSRNYPQLWLFINYLRTQDKSADKSNFVFDAKKGSSIIPVPHAHFADIVKELNGEKPNDEAHALLEIIKKLGKSL